LTRLDFDGSRRRGKERYPCGGQGRAICGGGVGANVAVKLLSLLVLPPFPPTLFHSSDSKQIEEAPLLLVRDKNLPCKFPNGIWVLCFIKSN